jgi:hypothetical protein
MLLIFKLKFYLKNYGLFFTFKKIALYPLELYRNIALAYSLRTKTNNEELFTHVYNDSLSRKIESASGVGSTLIQTQNIRKELPIIIEKFNIQNIVDAPCGDLNWIKEFLNDFKGEYIGIDIVKPVIDKLSLHFKHKSEKIKFIHSDLLLIEVLPKADLLIARDFLFHLSLKDINKFLNVVKKSNIKYILTTSYESSTLEHTNSDIKTGGFRAIDLFLPPFNFSQNYIYKFIDSSPPEPVRYSILWRTNSFQYNQKNNSND